MWTAAGTRLLTAHIDVLLFFENGKLCSQRVGEAQIENVKQR